MLDIPNALQLCDQIETLAMNMGPRNWHAQSNAIEEVVRELRGVLAPASSEIQEGT